MTIGGCLVFSKIFSTPLFFRPPFLHHLATPHNSCHYDHHYPSLSNVLVRYLTTTRPRSWWMMSKWSILKTNPHLLSQKTKPTKTTQQTTHLSYSSSPFNRIIPPPIQTPHTIPIILYSYPCAVYTTIIANGHWFWGQNWTIITTIPPPLPTLPTSVSPQSQVSPLPSPISPDRTSYQLYAVIVENHYTINPAQFTRLIFIYQTSSNNNNSCWDILTTTILSIPHTTIPLSSIDLLPQFNHHTQQQHHTTQHLPKFSSPTPFIHQFSIHQSTSSSSSPHTADASPPPPLPSPSTPRIHTAPMHSIYPILKVVMTIAGTILVHHQG